jgi:hypothetical protein
MSPAQSHAHALTRLLEKRQYRNIRVAGVSRAGVFGSTAARRSRGAPFISRRQGDANCLIAPALCLRQVVPPSWTWIGSTPWPNGRVRRPSPAAPHGKQSRKNSPSRCIHRHSRCHPRCPEDHSLVRKTGLPILRKNPMRFTARRSRRREAHGHSPKNAVTPFCSDRRPFSQAGPWNWTPLGSLLRTSTLQPGDYAVSMAFP